MKKLIISFFALASLFMFTCAPLDYTYLISSAREKVLISQLIPPNQTKEMELYLASIPIRFIDGAPLGCSELGSDGQMHSATACYYPDTNIIEVSTIDFNKSGAFAFRYESDIAKSIKHELCHAAILKLGLGKGQPDHGSDFYKCMQE
jgi:hypothetical protein